jgi:uncharacterized membrane protein
MSRKERRPAVLLVIVGAAVGLVGFGLADERFAALAWLLAVPMLAGGLLTLAWGNAREELVRRLPSHERRR